jgi:hypothetical protein
MTPKELDKHTLYFKVLAKPDDGSAERIAIGVGLLEAGSHFVTAICPANLPVPTGWKSLLFEEHEIAQFVRNDSKKSFKIEGVDYTPDFIYIQPFSQETISLKPDCG